MQNLTLKVVDSNAPSDKYPNWGYSIDFVDSSGNKYFVEYPNFAQGYLFLENMTYNFDACTQVLNGILGGTYTKLTRIKNIREVNQL
jgi:hypothetical protein